MSNGSAAESDGRSDDALRRDAYVKTAQVLADVLDATVRIPGTALTIGLDPLLGLIPAIGDAIAGMIGAVILGLATRLRVPRIVVARMSLNLLINGIVGTVPVLGDLFSVWFRSNTRNAALLREAAVRPDRNTAGDWTYVAVVIGGTVGLLLATIALVIWLAISLWSRLAGIA